MSDKFRIFKADTGLWALDYPDRYMAGYAVRQYVSTFAAAIAHYIRDIGTICPMCQRGTVKHRDWGWECTTCGSSDVAIGCVRTADA